MSATMYQFPVGGRRITGGRPTDAKPNLGFVISSNLKTVLGSSWYHDEAIEQDRTPKN